MLRLRVGPYTFRAVLEADDAPRTCELVRSLLPLHSKIIHARWSGEALWVPGGDVRLPPGLLAQRGEALLLEARKGLAPQRRQPLLRAGVELLLESLAGGQGLGHSGASAQRLPAAAAAGSSSQP